MKFISILIVCLLLGLFCGCAPSELEPRDYIQWVENPENSLIKDYTEGDLKLTCTYTPNEYAALKPKDPANLNMEELKEEVNGLNELVQFKLKFENTTSGNFLRGNYMDQEEYNRRSMYMSFDIRYDLNLIQNSADTVVCNMNHHERTYGNTPFETILISFPKVVDKIDEMTLVFNDRVFGFGRVKFKYPKSVLNDIPALKGL